MNIQHSAHTPPLLSTFRHYTTTNSLDSHPRSLTIQALKDKWLGAFSCYLRGRDPGTAADGGGEKTSVMTSLHQTLKSRVEIESPSSSSLSLMRDMNWVMYITCSVGEEVRSILSLFLEIEVREGESVKWYIQWWQSTAPAASLWLFVITILYAGLL